MRSSSPVCPPSSGSGRSRTDMTPWGSARDRSSSEESNRRLQLADLRVFAARLCTYLQGVPEAGSGSRRLRPKGNLTRAELFLLLALAIVPLISVAIRISALPGMLGPPMSKGLLPSIGHELNQMLSLDQTPATDRGQILYLLFLPTGALIVAIARLTFGLRVIGFRSILISVGFQHAGILPSLMLIAVVVTTVLTLRPALVRFRLPYYARLSVVMSLSVVILLLSLLVAPWLRSDMLFGLGFFPVLILGLLAERIAKTLDRDSWRTACWRGGMTLGIAILLAGIGMIPGLREVQIRFPELVLTQFISVIFVSEYLDFRMFQDLDARLSGVAAPRLFSDQRGLRVAVVRNLRRNGVVGRLGEPSPPGYDQHAIRRIVAALRARGYTVRVFEGDMRLLSGLRDFIPSHPRTGTPGGLVLNLAHGIQGELPGLHVPAMLEMSGVPYTGATRRSRLVSADPLLMAALRRNAGLEALALQAVRSPSELRGKTRFPVVVEPRYGPRAESRVVRNRRQLEDAIKRAVRQRSQGAIVRSPVSGPEIQVAVIGNDPPECLPLIDPGSRDRGLQCPATLAPALAQRIADTALAAFRALHCRDYALVRLRVSRSGKLQVIEVGQAEALAPGRAFALAAEAAGMSLGELLERIIEAARSRYREGVTDIQEVVPRRSDEAGPVDSRATDEIESFEPRLLHDSSVGTPKRAGRELPRAPSRRSRNDSDTASTP